MTVTERFLTSCVWAVFLIGSHTMPGQWHSQPTLPSLGQRYICMFRCNLPSTLLAEWPGYFTCYCSNTGVERTPNKSQHTKLTLEKKILSPPLLGFELATFQSRVQCSNQQAILASLHIQLIQEMQLVWSLLTGELHFGHLAVFRKGEHYCPENFQPISLMSVVQKSWSTLL